MTDTSGGRSQFYLCTHVTPECPIKATVLGYLPNRGANIFFCVTFGICALLAFVPGMIKRTWWFTLAVTSGLILEVVGYVCRILLYNNPWSQQAFEIQVITIILGPTLINAGIYFTLNHIAKAIGPKLGRLPPNLYTWIFIPSDVFCLVLQAIGGSLSAASDTSNRISRKELNIGNDFIIAGIALQVVSLMAFGALVGDFLWRVHESHRYGRLPAAQETVWKDRKFRTFGGAIAGAYFGILIRCIYRIVEMSGGWGNPIMRNEGGFIALEGVMILIPAMLLATCPPALLFPEMRSRWPIGRGQQEARELEVTEVEKGSKAAAPGLSRSAQ